MSDHLACGDCGSTWFVTSEGDLDRENGAVAFESDGRVSAYMGSFDCYKCGADIKFLHRGGVPTFDHAEKEPVTRGHLTALPGGRKK